MTIPAFDISQTPGMWICVPHPLRVRKYLTWLGATAAMIVALFCVTLWIVFALQAANPVVIAVLSGLTLCCLIPLGRVFAGYWRERRLALRVDRAADEFALGASRLCGLDQIKQIAVDEEPGTGAQAFTLSLLLDDRRTLELPVWFRSLTKPQAEALRDSLAEFLAGDAAAQG